jgi:hypothetical protein
MRIVISPNARHILQRATEYKVRNASTTGPDADGRQNLEGRYGQIGISAVTTALMCIRGVKHRDQLPESQRQDRRNGEKEKQLQHRRKGARAERSTKSLD